MTFTTASLALNGTLLASAASASFLSQSLAGFQQVEAVTSWDPDMRLPYLGFASNGESETGVAPAPFYGLLQDLDNYQEIVRRVQLPGLAADYAVETEVEIALRTLEPDPERELNLNEFKRVVRGRRRAFQRAEVERLHRQWRESGGRLRAFSDQNLDVFLKLMLQGETLVAGGISLVSQWFGPIEPARLNQGLAGFSGGAGQIQLLSALAVVTGRFDLNLPKLPAALKAAGGEPRTHGWKKFPIDWRRGQVIWRDRKHCFTADSSGYATFARDYADGAMQKAYVLASALLTKPEFQKLNWGKGIQLKVDQVEVVRQALRDNDYSELTGYMQFARDYADGAMQKAYVLASALLTKQEFQKLNWGKAIQLKVDQVEAVRQALRDNDYSELTGYMQFARDHVDGAMQKAYVLASALLTKAEFQKLKWGIQILLKVDQVEAVRQQLERGLADGILVGTAGWLRYQTETPAPSPKTAWQNASALLGDRFAELGWPSVREAVALAEKWQEERNTGDVSP
jgi:hypothetical protein